MRRGTDDRRKQRLGQEPLPRLHRSAGSKRSTMREEQEGPAWVLVRPSLAEPLLPGRHWEREKGAAQTKPANRASGRPWRLPGPASAEMSPGPRAHRPQAFEHGEASE